MKIKKNGSPYAEMYLIPPNMYEKLLACLHETEIKQVEDLNREKETEEQPGDKQIELLSKEALDIEPETEQQINPENIEEMQGESNLPEVEPEMQGVHEYEPLIEPEPELITEPSSDTDILARDLSNRMKGRILFKKPEVKVFTCQVCLKHFSRNYDLLRHLKTVHKNLQLDIPAMLNIKQSIEEEGEHQPMLMIPRTKKSLLPPTEEDIEMIREVPTPAQPSCKVSSDTTTRVIPELYFKPPKNQQMIVPQIKKRLMLVPEIKRIGTQGKITKPKSTKLVLSEKKKQLLVPSITKKQPLKVIGPKETEMFEDWQEGPKIKGKRSASEAKLAMKPSKSFKTAESSETEEEEEQSTKKKGARTSSEAKLKMKPAKYAKAQSFKSWS